jgi:hypothetical protein
MSEYPEILIREDNAEINVGPKTVKRVVSGLRSDTLRYCLETPGLRRFATRRMSPAFFYTGLQRYGKLPEKFRQLTGSRIEVVTYPKSGSVWVNSLIASALNITTADDGGCRVHFTHWPEDNRWMFNPNLLRGVFLMRDMRDIIVSLYHFMKTEHFIKRVSPHHIFDNMSDMYFQFFLPYYIKQFRWEEIPETYMGYGWPMVKYENLWDNGEIELRRLIDRWEIDVTDEKIRQAVEDNSVGGMRSGKGSYKGLNTQHVRKGGYGNYKEDMPADVLADVEKRFGSFLQRWGYKLGE